MERRYISTFRSDRMKAVKHKALIPKEHEEQSAFVKWFRFNYPSSRLAAVPNGLRTSFKQAIKAKSEGMAAGFPDLMLFHGGKLIFIEMKRTKGGVVSPEQRDWHKFLEYNGFKVIVARGFIDAINQFKALTVDTSTMH